MDVVRLADSCQPPRDRTERIECSIKLGTHPLVWSDICWPVELSSMASNEPSMWRQALDTFTPKRPSPDAIAARAYAKHLADPARSDRAVDNWLEAERELTESRLRE